MPVIRNGDADISFEVAGDGEPLLMLMGFAADARMWLMQTPALATRYTCILLDNRGTGASTLPDRCDMAMLAGDARAVLDHLGVERVRVLGISMGGTIAQHLVLDNPERVRSVVLAATWCARNAYTQRVAELGRQIYGTLGHEAIIRAFMLWLFSARFLIENPEFAANIEALMARFTAPERTFMLQLEALLEHDVRDRLGEVDVPTLVMHGRRDILVPPELGEEVAKAIPGAEMRMFETAHAFNVEEADAFNATVLAFFQQH